MRPPPSSQGHPLALTPPRSPLPSRSANGNGGFLTSCHTHCEAQGSDFTKFAIDGVTMGDAVRAWLASNAAAAGGAAPSAPNWHSDCAYDPATSSHQCNPTCGAGSAGMQGATWW